MPDAPLVAHGVAGLEAGHGRLAIAVGVFDGLHRGHRHLLRRLVRQAHAWGARPAVVTFDHHPDEILRGSAPPLLLDPEERLMRLGQEGIELVVVEHFDERLRNTPYDAFVRGIAERIQLAGFVMTPDAAFGFERRGTPTALAELGRTSGFGFDVAVVPPLTVEGRAVTSSAIRADIAQGDLAAARRLLGRAHAVVGDLVGGRLRFEMPVALPPPAVYRARVGRLDGLDRGTAASVTVVDGEIRLGPGSPVGHGQRLRVAFADSGASGAL